MVAPRPPRVAMTDREIRAVTIGEPTRLDGPVLLHDYDPTWPEKFALESARIQRTLGRRALRIEHIGSTAVPGLAAKPIIDILLVVVDSADEPSYVPALEAAGYLLRIREPEWHQHRLFKGPDTDINLHVFSIRSPEIARVLAFRDRLRTDPADRDLYAETKRSLAKTHWKYRQNYADAKSEVVEGILSRAAVSDPTR